jgi:predicted enzyme related to lactoylglutathione lyase
MTKLDPIIAVKDVEASAEWYQSIFDCRRTHGGSDFAVLVSDNDEILICLHKWGMDEHPTMMDTNVIPGNGLILYFKVGNLRDVRQRVEENGYSLEEDIHTNPNSLKKEFSLRDPDGYYLTVTEYHEYEG